MEHFACSIKDVKAGAFMSPFFVPSVAVADRMFSDLVNDPKEGNLLYTHPEDFEVYCLVVWDDLSGLFPADYDGGPQLIARGVDVVRSVSETGRDSRQTVI